MGLPTFLTQLYLQIIGGTAPSGAGSASGDISQMVKYVAAGSVSAYAAVPQPPLRMLVPDITKMGPGTGTSTGGGLVQYKGTQAWPANNDAVFMPFEITVPVTVDKIHVLIGTSSGNIDVGIYDSSGTRLVSAGSTAMAAAGVQTFDVANTALAKGRYFLGVAVSATAASLFGFITSGTDEATMLGFKKQATALPLPSPATFATPTTARFPLVVLELV